MSNKNNQTKRPKVGDIFLIELPNGHFAYGCIFKDASVGIYNRIDVSPTVPTEYDTFAFHVGMFKDALVTGQCPIIGKHQFSSEDSKWPPPNCIIDPISGSYQIYHKGEMRPANKQECDGMEEAAVWHIRHIVDRIMKTMKGI